MRLPIHGCLALALTLVAAASPVLAAEDSRPSARFRAGHAEIQVHLRHLDGMLVSLATAPAAEQRQTMGFVAKFLAEHIRTHAEWEEAKLYPLVDEKSGRGGERFSSSMRYEHQIIGRGIDELAALAAAESLDVPAFVRAGHRLLGVIAAHFEKEEEVFLPILDRTMSREELEEALGETGAGHGHGGAASPR
jgi:hemerythrin-like domain-containing protein